MNLTLNFAQFLIVSLIVGLSRCGADECEFLGNLRACRPVAKGWIGLPNSLGHTTQNEIANSAAYRFLENVSLALNGDFEQGYSTSAQPEKRQRCEIQIYQLACSVIAPKCYYVGRIQVKSKLPCQDVCTEVKRRCEELLVEQGLRWPDYLQCSHFQRNLPAKLCRRNNDVLAPISRSSNWRTLSVNRRRKGTHRTLPPIVFRHNSREGMIRIMKRVVLSCPDITRLYTVGKSFQKRALLVMEFSDNPGKHERSEPEMKWVGGIHGNEVLGREMMIIFAQYICREWRNNNKRIRRMLTTTRLHIMPSMNPDGYVRAARQAPNRRNWITGRFSAKGYDLNRNFPDLTSIMYEHERHNGPNHHLQVPPSYWIRKPEARFSEIHAIIKWIERYPFVLSAQLHGGELVANYPYDIKRPHRGRGIPPARDYARCPDDEVFRGLASLYAQRHLTMSDPDLNTCDSKFGRQGGITNGADWYTVHGGMQDFNYLRTNCFEILLELSCVKFPPSSVLSTEWDNNKEAILAYTEAVHWGIKGIVVSGNGTAIHNAVIHVSGIEHDITTNIRGDYWRLLMPGIYHLTVSRRSFMSVTRQVEVSFQNSTTVENFVLLKNEQENRPL